MQKQILEYSLKPRLLMLQHLSQSLKKQLSAFADQAYAHYSGQHSVQWEHFQNLSPEQEFTTIRSLEPLSLPLYQGVTSSMQSDPLENIEAETLYQYPEFHFSLLTPQGHIEDQKIIEASQSQIFQSSMPEKQVLEYLATLFDLELSQWQFSCYRKNKQIIFQAQDSKAGWNLRLEKMVIPNPKPANICFAGLKEGLSTRNPDQSSGQLAFLFWGPYMINEQLCEICLPGSKQRDDFASLFIQELQTQIAHTHTRVFWDHDMHLNLQSTLQGTPILISQEPPPQITPPHQPLILNLPTGKHLPPPAEQQIIGKIILNEIEINISGRQSEDFHLSRSWLLKLLNSFSEKTHVVASMTQSDHLKLESLSPLKSISVKGQAHVLKLLGLSEGETQQLDKADLEQKIAHWQRLVSRLYIDLNQVIDPSPKAQHFLDQLIGLPKNLGSCEDEVNINPIGWRQFPGKAALWLDALIEDGQQWFQHLVSETSSEQSSDQIIALQTTAVKSQTKRPTEQLPEVNENQKEKPKSTFDHKI